MTGYYTAVRLGPDKRPSNGTELKRGTEAECLPYWKAGKVVICWNYDAPPPKRWPQETLARVRKQRLRKRIESRYPLFSEELIENELQARPEYFSGKKETQS